MSSSSSSMRSGNPIVRRVVNLPRNILIGFSRAVHQGLDLIGSIGPRTRPPNQSYNPQNPNFQQPYTFQEPSANLPQQEEWAFLSTFEQQYGTMHPFFYACRFMDALKIAQEERKFLFMYLHSPEHPFTPSFCRETLCSEVVVQFLDASFVSWGGLASRGEGLNMATALRVSGFPFCAVVAPASGDNLAVLQQMEGPVSPGELLEVLQRTMEEQGVAFGSGRAKQEAEKLRADRRLREEQDAAYAAALKLDQEKERLKKNNSSSLGNKFPKAQKPKDKNPVKKSETSRRADASTSGQKGEITPILIRFPNGERREQSFMSTDKIQAIYRYIDSLGLPGVGNYRLISNFPRKVYGADQMGMTLKEAGLNPKASIFLELL